MKFMFLILFSSTSFAKISIDKIKSLKHDGALYEVHFMGTSRTYKLSGNNPIFPCLENAQKSSMFVTIDTEAQEIRSCKLTPNRLPGSFNGKLK